MKSKLLLCGLLVVMLGCGGTTEEPADTPAAPAEGDGAAVTDQAATLTLVSAVKYCGSCGQEKGSADCCLEDAETCADCNLAKGSPLCCKVPAELAGKDLCGKCGNVAGSEECCQEGAVMCVKCGLAEGATLCCKLTETES
jgi:hypothetical protein